MKIFRFLIYTLIFLLPLFWLPFSFEFVEFNKLYFLLFFTWLLILVWLLRQLLIEKEIRFYFTRLDILILIFVLISLLALAFTKDKIGGFFGSYGRFNDGVLTLLSLFLLFILIRNNLQTEKQKGEITLSGIFNSLFLSSFLVLIWTMFSLFGIWQKIPKIGQYFIFSPVSASISALSNFFSLILVLVLTRFLVEKDTKLIKKILYVLFLVLALFTILFLDVKISWIILTLSLIFLLVMSLKERIFREEVQKLILPIFFLFIALIFSFLSFQGLVFVLTRRTLFPNLIRERILPQSESWRIALKSSTSSFKNAILGSGPATFLSNFSKFKSERMLENDWWFLRFNFSGNFLSEILASFGFLGLISFLIILIWLLFLVILKSQEKKFLCWGVFLFGIFLLPFLSFLNINLLFLFFLGLAITTSFIPSKEKRYLVKEFPEVTLTFETLIIILGILFFVALIFGIKFYFEDHYYQKGFLTADLDKKIEFFQKAAIIDILQYPREGIIFFNPYRPYYQTALSQVLVSRVQNEIQKGNPDSDLIQRYIFIALDLAKRTAAANQVIYVENLARIYRNLIGLAQGAEDWAERTYREAISLEPKNPLYFIELGRIKAAARNFEEAKSYFQKALELVPDLIEAKIQIALVLSQEGKIEEAISEFENIAREHPFNAEIPFYLGILYYNKKELDKAIENFQVALTLSPNYANARYFLALSFEEKGDLKRALEELKIVEIDNPENQILKNKIEEIQKKLENEQN